MTSCIMWSCHSLVCRKVTKELVAAAESNSPDSPSWLLALAERAYCLCLMHSHNFFTQLQQPPAHSPTRLPRPPPPRKVLKPSPRPKCREQGWVRQHANDVVVVVGICTWEKLSIYSIFLCNVMDFYKFNSFQLISKQFMDFNTFWFGIQWISLDFNAFL